MNERAKKMCEQGLCVSMAEARRCVMSGIEDKLRKKKENKRKNKERK